MSDLTAAQIEIQRILEAQFIELQSSLEQHCTSSSQLSDLEEQVQRELLQKILELGKAIVRNEERAKRLLHTEMEMKHFKQEEERLELELEKFLLEHQRGKRNLLQYQERNRLVMQRSQIYQEKIEAFEQELVQQKDLRHSLKEEIQSLEQDRLDLEKENERHQQQILFLQENIARLRQMKEENLLSVMNLTNTLTDVSSGKDS